MKPRLNVTASTDHSGDRVAVVRLTSEILNKSWRIHPDFDGLSERAVRLLCSIINGVVDDLPEAVHETTRVGRTDVHSRALTDCLESFENAEVSG